MCKRYEVPAEIEWRLPQKWDCETDVIVVGSGFSGLAAAIEAHDAGASVLVLEKTPNPGGNSIIAGGGVNSVDTERQRAQGVNDSFNLHFKHTFEGGNCLGDPEKIRFLVENALEMCVRWLEMMGIEWPDKVVMGYGSLWERTHLPPRFKRFRGGAAIVWALLDQLEKRGIPILLGHEVVRITRERPLGGRVLGVEVEHESRKMCFRAKRAVVLASGGFAGDLEMVMDHCRRLADTPTTNHHAATGECIKMAQDIGADVLHMDHIQCVPWRVRPPFKGMFFQITSRETRVPHTYAAYTIFVDKNGNRFVREDGRRDEIMFAASSLPLFESVPTVETDTIEELEDRLTIPRHSLVETIHRYNSYCEVGRDQDFCKNPHLLVPCKTPPFRAETKAMARHYTMGGLKVLGTRGQVIDRWGRIIPGFYAAGEITGGTHGSNRLGHNATPDCIIFGRICGKMAAADRSKRNHTRQSEDSIFSA